MTDYEDILPDNWLAHMTESNNTYMKHRARYVHPLMRAHRICLDRENLCPAKRLGGCIVSHCVLRYPTEKQYTHFK